MFHSIPASFAGTSVGSGTHAFTWCLAVAACEILGSRAHHYLIVAAVKMSDPSVRILQLDLNREAMQGLFVEVDLGVLITLAVGLSPALVLIAMPTVLLVRRFLVFPLLVAQSRVDSKTGLLNVSTWEAEAEVELSRARRTQSPLAMALVDIDHFKAVNDTYGHLVGDRVLKSVAQALTSQLRDYDRAGRFGGEEFVLLLAQTSEADACGIAERLRSHVAGHAGPCQRPPERADRQPDDLHRRDGHGTGRNPGADRPARRRGLGAVPRQANRQEPDRHPRRGEQHGPRRRVRRPPHGRCPGRPDRRFFTPIEVTLRIH